MKKNVQLPKQCYKQTTIKFIHSISSKHFSFAAMSVINNIVHSIINIIFNLSICCIILKIKKKQLSYNDLYYNCTD